MSERLELSGKLAQKQAAMRDETERNNRRTAADYHDVVFRPTEVCICGRSSNPPHCFLCGSTNVLAKARRNIYVDTKIDGVRTLYRGFQCKKCGAPFDFTQTCEAPQRTASASFVKKTKETISALDNIGADPLAMRQQIEQEHPDWDLKQVGHELLRRVQVKIDNKKWVEQKKDY